MTSMGNFLFEAELRRDELMAQAEQYRLARQLPRRNSPIGKISQRLLACLGDLLVAWGSQLQTRFATESSTSLGTTSENPLRACH